MNFKRFDPGSCKLAAPRVSALPTLSSESLAWRSTARSCAAQQPHRLGYLRSRYALTDAYRLSGVGRDRGLLAPAYHCLTMLDPALRLGARCHLYPLRPDLGVEVPVIDRLLTEAGGTVAALLATHFFGFVQDFRDLADCCARHDVHLIEDCSHVLPALPAGGGAGATLGAFGRYSVWSPYKFFACEDGGYLQVNGGASVPEQVLVPQTVWDELKGLARLLRRSTKDRKRIELSELDDLLASTAATGVTQGIDLEEHSSAPSGDYLVAQERMAMSHLSRWIVGRADVDRVKGARRRRYMQWLEASAGWPHCQPLYAELPVDCVPYMFPLHVDCPEAHFLPLKSIGVPVWRWDSMGVSGCPVASDYRLHVFQLPCHQELNDAEMAWMMTAVSSVLGGARTSA